MLVNTKANDDRRLASEAENGPDYEENMTQQLLTVDETAKMLRLQESTIRSWILKRRIPFVRLGRRVFVRQHDCEQLIADSVVQPATGKASAA